MNLRSVEISGCTNFRSNNLSISRASKSCEREAADYHRSGYDNSAIRPVTVCEVARIDDLPSFHFHCLARNRAHHVNILEDVGSM